MTTMTTTTTKAMTTIDWITASGGADTIIQPGARPILDRTFYIDNKDNNNNNEDNVIDNKDNDTICEC